MTAQFLESMRILKVTTVSIVPAKNNPKHDMSKPSLSNMFQAAYAGKNTAIDS